MKQTVKPPGVPQSHQIAHAISKFDDDKEIQEEEDDAPHRTDRLEPTRLKMELQTVDMSFQIPVFCKVSNCCSNPKLVVVFLVGPSNQQGLEDSDSEIDSEPFVRKSRTNPSSSCLLDLQMEIDNIIEKRTKEKGPLLGESSKPQSNLPKSDLEEGTMTDPLHNVAYEKQVAGVTP
jgi:hypothetical protein